MKKFIISTICSLMCVGLHAQQYESSQYGNSCCDSTCLCNGDCCLTSGCPTYNIPAALKLDCSWGNIIGSVSWLYWHTAQEGFDLATTMSFAPGAGIASPISAGGRSKTVYSDFDYHSGFKLALGSVFGSDSWVWNLGWTRLHNQTKTTRTAPSLTGSVGSLLTTNWFFPLSSLNQSLASSEIHSSWNLHLDWIDLTLSRPFYQGMCITLNPFAGLRASIIKQSFNVTLDGLLNITPPTAELTSHNHSHSWAIGPRAGVETRFLLGMGFRLQGEIGGSLLYTRYTKISHSDDTIVEGGSSVAFSGGSIGALRPMLEANLGAGWGWCPCSQGWHLDFTATYDFNYLWSQNMMRALNDWTFIGSAGSPGDLNMHGLTLTATVQF